MVLRPVARFAALLLAAGLVAGGCDSGPPAPPQGSKGIVTVGAGARPEAQIVARMYALALTKAGWEVHERLDAGARDAYLPALQRGELDVVPEYLSDLTRYLAAGRAAGTAGGRPPVSGDAERTARSLQSLLAGRPLHAGRLSPATDQTAYAVGKDLADREGLATMSDLARLNGQLVLGAPPGCATAPSCLVGLQGVYGLRFKEVRTVGEVSSRPVFAALRDRSIDVGPVQSSAGGVAAGSLVVLKDDKHLQDAQNILALYRAAAPADARDVVEKVNQALTTEKLQELNKRYELDGEDPADLAKRFLQDAGLV